MVFIFVNGFWLLCLSPNLELTRTYPEEGKEMVPVPAILSMLITDTRLSGPNGGDPSGCLYNVLPLENKQMEAPSSRCAPYTVSSPLL